MITNKFVNIDNARTELIGKKFEILDIEERGRALYLQDDKGRIYVIDNTGKNGARVCAQKTDNEELEELKMKFDALMRKFNVDEEDLFNYME